MKVALAATLAPTKAILWAPSFLITSALRVVNSSLGSLGWLFRNENMFGYLPQSATPTCHPVTGTPCLFR